MTVPYLPPVDRLLRLGREPALRRMWPDYVVLGLEPRHVPALARMAADPALLGAPERARERWAPVHAWRALGQLEAPEAVAPLMALLRREAVHPWVGGEVPVALGFIGGPALPAATLALFDEGEPEAFRCAVARMLAVAGTEHADRRDEAAAVLAKQMEDWAHQSPALNAELVLALCALQATDAAPLMEAAFAAGRVDVEIAGTWDDAQVDLGMATELEATEDYDPDADLGPNPARRPPADAAEKARRRRKAAKDARKRNRKKK